MVFTKTRKTFILFVVGLGLLLGVTQIFSVFKDNGNLIINEFAAANGNGLTDEDGDYSDWIEIYNQGSTSVNLAGWALTDDPKRPEKWTLPDVTLGSGGYLVIFASGKNRTGDELHTNFKLSEEGEFLGIYNVLGNDWVDAISPAYPRQFQNVAYGRFGQDSVFAYLSQPTPGYSNSTSQMWEAVTDIVEFSAHRGFYETPFALELSTATPGAAIYYTTDGSEPTEATGTLYTAPLSVSQTTFVRAAAYKPNFKPSPVNTHTYIFLDNVLAQSSHPPNFPETWGVHPNNLPVIADYEMDPAVVNDPRYSPLLREGLTSIPTLSIVTDVKNLIIYANPGERGAAWERPASVELINPNSEAPDFQINAGLRIQGGVGRSTIIPKHAFRLFFKSEYGSTKLNYPLFPDSPVQEFDTLILRAGMNRSYAGKIREDPIHLNLTTYTRDEWLRASQIEMSGVGSHGIFVHLYLNGLYWGLYNIVERPDASFLSSYLGGTKEDWYVINHSGPVSGAGDRFEMLHNLAENSDLEDPNTYAKIREYLDIPHFIDYIIVNLYNGNQDWALTNWYAGVSNRQGRVKYFVWDGEWTWVDGASLQTSPPGAPPIRVEVLLNALMQNPDFRMEFADRLYKHLYNNGALTDKNSQARWRQINAVVEKAVVAESARWGDVRYEPPLNYDDWLNARDNVLAQMEGNAAKLVALTRQAGYYPPIDPPAFNKNGGMITPGFELIMTAEDGAVYYTTNGSDPRQAVTGNVAPAALLYQAPVVITTTTQVKARLLLGQTWSALHEADFYITEHDPRLRITELMYNPPGGGDYEFIELKNVGQNAVDLSEMFFEGVRYTFPPRTPLLEAGEFFVVVRNPEAFAQRYPGVAVGGVFSGQLSNQGETISLLQANGQGVLSITYDDEQGWPVSPDGRGDSLVLINEDGDPNNPHNWRAGANLYGSPGMDNSAP